MKTTTEAVMDFLALLPVHSCHLQLSHNEHRVYYVPASSYANDKIYAGAWKDDEAKARAIATDEIWELQWYPNTPVGFRLVCAPTLLELIELANDEEGFKALTKVMNEG